MLKQSLIALSLFAAVSSAHGADIEKMRKQLTENMPGMQIGSITKAPYGGLYEFVANGYNVYYTDENASVVFVGKVVDLKTKKNLVEERSQQLMKVNFASLPLDKAIVKVKGNGNRKLAIFSDPDCPACQQLEPELAKLNDVTIYTFLYPVTELHPDAERKAKLVWCAEDRGKAWDDIMLKGKEPAASKKECDAPLKAIQEVAKKSWIQATPSMVFSDNKLVPGGLPSVQIERLLAASQPVEPPVAKKN